jgi:hypothetical protein
VRILILVMVAIAAGIPGWVVSAAAARGPLYKLQSGNYELCGRIRRKAGTPDYPSGFV